ncbi:hypothetical protein P153DRAFT_391679 [Dothidotthia symphoricarpi CBS 119687]|uniref:Uncharacterized protein n=1 Tax=Dothidotthia symphoricarpi CBS 119687 TaxID=1392245 RepID=A0A6A5ZUH5_9PLEO|nr:uncharacterized protein P153DRAFT_391679 [Dothidotthia symphoricarpi CBS 119687]KAF2123300.1 hypothetical protein P153DRAFT_391679 [Dothidotthia symphoricarpi CBS 119687]
MTLSHTLKACITYHITAPPPNHFASTHSTCTICNADADAPYYTKPKSINLIRGTVKMDSCAHVFHKRCLAHSLFKQTAWQDMGWVFVPHGA